MKNFIKTIFKYIGILISWSIQIPYLFKLYNYMFENSPQQIIRFCVKYVNLPEKDNKWIIKLINGKKVYTKIEANDFKTTQFALSYKWHSPSLNFTEKILNEFYPIEIPWIDIGSNLGLRSLLSLSESRPVYFIEPNVTVNKLNVERCRLNNFKNYTLFEVGASDKRGKVEFTIDKSSYNSSIENDLLPEDNIDHKEIITIETIDNLFENLISTGKTACIKIDVEGHELNVLNGAKRIISKLSPTLIIEVNKKGQHFAEFVNYFTGLRYNIFEIGEFGKGRYYKKIMENQTFKDSDIQFNDFFAIKDEGLLNIVEKYTLN